MKKKFNNIKFQEGSKNIGLDLDFDDEDFIHFYKPVAEYYYNRREVLGLASYLAAYNDIPFDDVRDYIISCYEPVYPKLPIEEYKYVSSIFTLHKYSIHTGEHVQSIEHLTIYDLAQYPYIRAYAFSTLLTNGKAYTPDNILVLERENEEDWAEVVEV